MGCWGGDLYVWKEGVDDRQTLVAPPPGPWAQTLQRIRCWFGHHHGKWEYRTRSDCDQVLLCPVHGPTRSRRHHRWTRTNETLDEDLDNLDEVFKELHNEKSDTEYYRCRRCNETMVKCEPDPDLYRAQQMR